MHSENSDNSKSLEITKDDYMENKDHYVSEESWTTLHDDHYAKWIKYGSNCSTGHIEQIKNDNVLIKNELAELKESFKNLSQTLLKVTETMNNLQHELQMCKISNHDLRHDMAELTEREKNRIIRSGIPFRFMPSSNKSSTLFPFDIHP